jgi:hypothetical protein
LASSDELINRAVAEAIKYVGYPYVNTPPGARPPVSWDCSKLTAWAWGKSGKSLTPYSPDQYAEVKKISQGEIGKGDLLFYYNPSWGRIGHVVIVIGGGQIVEASSPSVGVRYNSIYFTNYVGAGRPHGIEAYGGGTGTGDPGGGSGDEKEDETLLPVVETRTVKKNAIATSVVAGTPQNARFAIMNVTNETVFLTQDTADAVSQTEFSLSGRAIISGDSKEYSRSVIGGKDSYELSLETNFIQSKSQAQAVANMIARTLEYKMDSVTADVFGNPLVQLGDTVKFNFKTRKILSGATDYYIVTKVAHQYSSSGLSTSITLKPLVNSLSVI